MRYDVGISIHEFAKKLRAVGDFMSKVVSFRARGREVVVTTCTSKSVALVWALGVVCVRAARRHMRAHTVPAQVAQVKLCRWTTSRTFALVTRMPLPMEVPFAIDLFFPTATFGQIFNEAVANALDAGADEITIHIVAKPLSITIRDNGEGFTQERFDRFRRLMKPKDQHHKGLGRLVYLHYFSRVSVESIFADSKRTFEFSNTFNGTSKIEKASDADARGTTLQFSEFIGERLRRMDVIKPENLKSNLIEHFLPILHDMKKDGKNFTISIDLSEGNKTQQVNMVPNDAIITPSDIPTLKCLTFTENTIDAFNEISMNYAVQRTDGKGFQLTAICVDGRTIPISLMRQNAIPIGCTVIFLFESKSFAGKSDSARQRLVFPENIPQEVVFRVLRRKMAAVLNDELPEIATKNMEIQERFEAQYPHLLGLFDKDTVGIIDPKEALENAQARFFQDQRSVLESETLDDATYEKTLEISSRALTEYILYREFIIKRLTAITADDSEAYFHNLVAPRYNQFDGRALADDRYMNNAWLLDDKFMTYRTLLSEATMREVIAAIAPDEDVRDDQKPDISMIFSASPTQTASVDVVIVELKKRQPNPKENIFASTQLVQRAKRLANYFPTIQRIWYFAVIDINEPLAELLTDLGFIALFSRGKHVFYHEYDIKMADGRTIPTPILLLSFDSIIADAAARNHTFLEILKEHFRKAAGIKVSVANAAD